MQNQNEPLRCKHCPFWKWQVKTLSAMLEAAGADTSYMEAGTINLKDEL